MSTDAHPAPDPDEWAALARTAARRAMGGGAIRDDDLDELTGWGLLAMAELQAKGELAEPPGWIVAAVALDIIDAIRSQRGRAGTVRGDAQISSLDERRTSSLRTSEAKVDALADPTDDELDVVLDLDEAQRFAELVRSTRLTRAQRQVVAGLRRGDTLKAIGKRLGVSESRVCQHVTTLRGRFAQGDGA